MSFQSYIDLVHKILRLDKKRIASLLRAYDCSLSSFSFNQGVHPGNTNSTPQPGVPDSTMLPPSTSLSPPAPNSPAPSSHALSPPGVLPAQPPPPLLPPTPSPVSYHNHLLPPSSHNHPVPSTYAPAPPAAPASFGPASSSTISNKEQGTTTSEGGKS